MEDWNYAELLANLHEAKLHKRKSRIFSRFEKQVLCYNDGNSATRLVLIKSLTGLTNNCCVYGRLLHKSGKRACGNWSAVNWFLPPFDQRSKSLYLFHHVAHRVSVWTIVKTSICRPKWKIKHALYSKSNPCTREAVTGVVVTRGQC